MKRFLFVLMVLVSAIILMIEPKEETTLSPDFYAVEAHPVEDTAHVIVVNR